MRTTVTALFIFQHVFFGLFWVICSPAVGADADLNAFSTSVVFLVGETSKTVLIDTNDDTLEEGPEVFLVTLSRLDVGVVVGEPSQSVVTIIDDEQGMQQKALLEKYWLMLVFFQ